jgi:hypothetical protein
VSEREDCCKNVCVVRGVIVKRATVALRVVISDEDVGTGSSYPATVVKVLETGYTRRGEAVLEFCSISELLHITWKKISVTDNRKLTAGDPPLPVYCAGVIGSPLPKITS